MKNIIKQLNPFCNQKVENLFLYIGKILLSTGLIYFVSLLVGEAIIIGGSYLFGYNATNHQMPYDIMLLCSFYGYIITIGLFLLFSKKINRLSFGQIGLNQHFHTFFKGIFFGTGTLLLIISILLGLKAITFHGINPHINWLLFVLYLFAYLIQSMMEELVCRGYLLHRLKDRIPLVYAVIISILFFGAGHFSKLFEEGILLGIIGVCNLILVSMIFVMLTLKHKNIYSAIGYHFIWNFTLFNIIGLNVSGLEATNAIFQLKAASPFLTGASYGIESSIITMVILLGSLWMLKRKK